MILDNPEKYLTDYETYKEIFELACSTVEVTVQENSILRQYTSNKDNYVLLNNNATFGNICISEAMHLLQC